MKTRGTRGGIILSLDKQDRVEDVQQILEENKDLFTGKVFVELSERIAWEVLEALQERLKDLGSQLDEVRPPGSVMQARGETLILNKTVRGGRRVESTGSIIILGDVNAGAEIIAEDDIIVIGRLRGIAHAGAGGNEKAIIWAQEIRAKQLRIGSALAQAGDGDAPASGAEIAQLVEGQIMLKPWDA